MNVQLNPLAEPDNEPRHAPTARQEPRPPALRPTEGRVIPGTGRINAINAETFCEHFATFADAPNGIDKLRELALQLAFQGKLVGQDETDEPASCLLERVIAAKEIDSDLPRSKSTKSVRDDAPDSVPFKIPTTWVWCHLEDIAPNVQYGYTASADASLQGIRLLRITDIQNNRVEWPSVPGCEIDEDTYKSYALQNDDVVIARTGGTIGKSFLVEDISVRAVFASYLIRVTPSKELCAKYIKRFLESPVFWTQRRAMSAGTGQPNLNGTALKSLLVPLPPLAEQRRIVEKVDQLLGLCDELAARQAAQREKRQRLVGATLDRRVSCRRMDENVREGEAPAEPQSPRSSGQTARQEPRPPGMKSDFAIHAHRLRNHFDQLFDTPTTIPQLRRAILQLAVQGQLVPQDPNDEPATVLLERVKNAGEQSRKSMRRTRSQFVDEDSSVAIPSGWVKTRLGEAFDVRDGTHDTPKYVESGFPLVTSKNLSSGRLELSNIKLISEADHRAIAVRSAVERGDILFAMIGSIGNPVVVETDTEFSIKNVALFKHRSATDSCPHFLLHYLRYASEEMRKQAAGGVQSFVSLGFLREYPIPLPPLAEQKRIVTRVTELLSLCDALEAKLTQAESASTRLLSAAVHHLLQT